MDQWWKSLKDLFSSVSSRLSDSENESSEEFLASDDTIFNKSSHQSSTSHENSEKGEDPETTAAIDRTELEVVELNELSIGPRVREAEYTNLLNYLNLSPDDKFTLKKARMVDNNTINDKALTSINEVPKYIVEKLMIVDYHARAFKLKPRDESVKKAAAATFDESDDEDREQAMEDERLKETVNPMDAFIAIFHCSDDFLRQDLAIKLSSCQLSVPFLLPDPVEPSEKITMLIWALEGIKKSWKSASKTSERPKAQHVFVLEHPFPVVTFVRIEKNGFSKSVLLNKVISDVNGYHDFFFHKDCKGGGVKRQIVDGLVELCWYLPEERNSQAFQNEICFANLRGDVRNFKKQLSVMTKISSVIFLILPSEYPNESTNGILIEMAKAETKFVLIFNDKPREDAKQYFDDFKRKHRGRFSSLNRSAQANEDDFVETIREKIQRNINTSKGTPLKEISATLANECNIYLDEDSDNNSIWRESISPWMNMGPKDAKMQLKLQTQVPVIASLERENFCPKPQANKSENERIDDNFKKKKEARDSQKESFF